MNGTAGASAPWQALVVYETASSFVVTSSADPDDWIARFEKTDGFPAREWAERMVELYNAGGIEGQHILVARRGLPAPPFVGYAPEQR